MKCRKCGFEIQDGGSFCPRCGTRVTEVCPRCGCELQEGQRFCPRCGAETPEAGRQMYNEPFRQAPSGVPAGPGSPMPGRPQKPKKKTGIVILVGVLAAALLIAVIYIVVTHIGQERSPVQETRETEREERQTADRRREDTLRSDAGERDEENDRPEDGNGIWGLFSERSDSGTATTAASENMTTAAAASEAPTTAAASETATAALQLPVYQESGEAQTAAYETTAAAYGAEESAGYPGAYDYYDDYQNNITYMYVVDCKESISLRESPSTSARVLTQIPLYGMVEFVDEADNGFYMVWYNGQLGYALASYLDIYEPQVYTGITYTVVNCNESITLRTSPYTSAEEICQIPLGAVVNYIQTAGNGFYLVNYNGRNGYALASYLKQQ